MASLLGGFAGLGGSSVGRASVDLILNAGLYNEQLAATEAKTKGSTAAMSGGFSKFQKDVRASFSNAQVAMVAFSAISALAIGKAISSTTKWADSVRTLQRTTGQSAESASTFTAAAEKLGVGVDKMQVGFGLLSKNIVNGSKNLDKYGISTRDATGAILPFDQVLANVSDKFLSLPKGPEQAAFAMNAFGRSGRQLIPILQQGSAGFDALRKEAEASGLVMSQNTLDASLKLEIAQRQLGDAVKGAAVSLGTSFLPLATAAAIALTTLVEKVQLIPKPMLALGAAFGVASGGILLAVKAFTLFKTTTLAFLASPAGLIALALAGIAAAFIQVQQNAKDAAASVKGAIGSVAAGVDIATGSVGHFHALASQVPADLASIQTQLNAAGVAMTALNFRLGQIDAALKAGKITLGEARSAYEVYGLSAKDAGDRANLFALKSTKSFNDVGKAVQNFADMSNQALHDFRKSVDDSITQTFQTLGTKTKDIFNITQRQLANAFDAMLRNAARFSADMAALLSLKPGSFGISKTDLQKFEAWMAQQAPGYIDAFVNASHAAQQRDIANWRRTNAEILKSHQELAHALATPITLHIDTSSASRELAQLKANFAAALSRQSP